MRKECEKAQSQRSEILTKLKADRYEVTVSQEKRMKDLRERYDLRMRDHQDAFSAKKAESEKKINELRDKNSKLRSGDQENEVDKQRNSKRYEKEVGDKIREYDERVRELVFQLGDTKDEFSKEERRLMDLRERFDKIDGEKECIRKEESIADARREKLKAEKDRKCEMAERVQAYWRGILTREQYAVMKKNKKKGKKGGGKKKK